MTLNLAPDREETNARARLAQLLPALLLAYFAIVWPLVYARGIVTADLATSPPPETQPFLLNRLFFPALAVLAVLLIVAERHRLGRFHLAGFFLVGGFTAYLASTALWALAPAVTVSKLTLLVMQSLALLTAALVARRLRDILEPLVWVMALMLLANAAAVLLLPPTPIGYAGIYSHKNTLGAMAAIGGLFAFYGLTRSGRLRVVGLVMLPLALVLLYLSRSKTALGLFLIAPLLALVAVLARRKLRIALAVLLVGIVLPTAFLLGGILPDFSLHDVSRMFSGDGTFTGRTDLWAFALSKIAERPLLGYGYQSFWGIGAASPTASLPDGFIKWAPHAHNGYLDLLLQGGAVALGLFLLILMMVAWWLDRVTDRDAGTGFFATALFLWLVLQNLLETEWLQGLSGPGLLVSLLILAASVKRHGRMLT